MEPNEVRSGIDPNNPYIGRSRADLDQAKQIYVNRVIAPIKAAIQKNEAAIPSLEKDLNSSSPELSLAAQTALAAVHAELASLREVLTKSESDLALIDAAIAALPVI